MARAREVVIFGVLLLSGAAGLVYELVWVRWFSEVFGGTAQAAAAVFAAYFGGLAIGSRWLGARAARISRPLRAYAGLELAAFGGVLVVPVLVRAWEPVHVLLFRIASDSPLLLTSAKLALAAFTLLPPCIALGGTLPVVVRALESNRSVQAGLLRANALYGANTLGATAGAALGAFFLPLRVGIHGTYVTGMSLQGLAIAGALAVGWQFRVATRGPTPPDTRSPLNARQILAALGTGAGALSIQMVLLRALDMVVVNSVVNTGITLVATLAAIAMAALIASIRAAVQRVSPGWLALFVAVALATLPAGFLGDLVNLQGAETIAAHRAGVVAAARNGAIWGLLLLTAASLLLPWMIARPPGTAPIDVPRRVGELMAWNIVGSIVGSLATGFVLFGNLGLWGTVTLLSAAYLCAALVVLARPVPIAIAACIAAGVLAMARPWAQPRLWLGRDEVLVAQSEGAHGLVSIVDDPSGRVMRIDNHYTLAGTGMTEHEERRGHLAILLHPSPRRVAVLGSATGLTAGAALLHPEVEHLDLVELVPEVAEGARRYFGRWNRGVHDAPVTRVITEDARNYMRVTSAEYDVVIGELFVPWNPGAAGMFTAEHFQAVRARLADGGVYCQWLPLYQLGPETFETIVATFTDVFPDTVLWRGSFLPDTPTVALCNTAALPDRAHLARRMDALRAAGASDRWITRPDAMAALRLGRADTRPFAGVRLNTSDRPWVELNSYTLASEKPLIGREWQKWTKAFGGTPSGQVLYEYQLARSEGREEDVERLAAEARLLLPTVFPATPPGARTP